MPSVISSFQGKYSFLSLVYQCAFYYQGDLYNSAAAAFEAAKIQNPRDRVSFVHWNCKPWQARSIGKGIPACWLRPDWSPEVEIAVMTGIQRSKFSWPELQKRLLATGDACLVNGNSYHDNFFGSCLCRTLPAKETRYGVSPRCTGTGRNELGRILMQVRQECRDGLYPRGLMPGDVQEPANSLCAA